MSEQLVKRAIRPLDEILDDTNGDRQDKMVDNSSEIRKMENTIALLHAEMEKMRLEYFANKEGQRKMVKVTEFNSRTNRSLEGGEAMHLDHRTTDMLYNLVMSNATARSMVNQIKDEIFREGLKVEEKFVMKCLVCNTEYNHEIEKCEVCGNDNSSNFKKPNLAEKYQLESFLSQRVNANKQKFIHILEELELDLDIMDDAFLIVRWSYYHKNGVILSKEFKDMYREYPSNIRFSVDEYNRIGNYEMTCLEHRQVHIEIDKIQKGQAVNQCPICGAQLHRVIAVRYKPGTHKIQTRFIEGEVFHTSKYSPTKLYGYPPALTLRNLLELIYNQEIYMTMYYRHRKLPAVGLGIPTKNNKDVKEFRDSMLNALKSDKMTLPVFKFDPDTKAMPTIIRFDDTPHEMNFIEIRQEARMRMSAFWGVSPLFQNDLSAASGLNNEILQIEVQNRTVIKGQHALKEGIIDPLVTELGFEDWVISFGKVEKDDEKKDIELDILRSQYALTMQSLGFVVDRDPNGNFVFMKAYDPNDPSVKQAQENLEAVNETGKDNKSTQKSFEKNLKEATPKNIGTSRLKGDYQNDTTFQKA